MPITIKLNAAAVKAIRDAAEKGEPVTITLDASATEKAADSLTAMFQKIGQTAEHIGNAAGNVSAVASPAKLDRARRALASLGAYSFASLLGLIGPVLRGQRPPE